MAKTNLFFEMFAGEFVEIITDLKIPQSINVDQEGNTTEVQMPLTVNGFFMDIDDNFVYLSPDGENVKQSIPVNSIKYIEIVNLEQEAEEMLDNIPEPDSGSYN